MAFLAVVAWVLTAHLEARVRALRANISKVDRQLKPVLPEGVAHAESPPADMTIVNRPATTTQALIASLQRDSLESSVELTTLHAQPSATQGAPDSSEVLHLGLHGTYPNVKRVLAATADRYSDSTLDRISLRRGAAGAGVDVTLLVTLGRPPFAAATQAGR